ncbi:MAG: phosphoketolase, partial [bacterium]|nr:phosphoketolase [bacterium]
ALITLVKKYLPKLNVRFVNVVDLMKLLPNDKHPHGLTDDEFDKLFTTNKPVIFNFHGYPQLIHMLTYSRHNQNLHVSGYCEEGTITTPFDMRVRNKVDRFNLMLKLIKYVKLNDQTRLRIQNEMNEKLRYHDEFIKENGVDIPEVADWNWNN